MAGNEHITECRIPNYCQFSTTQIHWMASRYKIWVLVLLMAKIVWFAATNLQWGNQLCKSRYSFKIGTKWTLNGGSRTFSQMVANLPSSVHWHYSHRHPMQWGYTLDHFCKLHYLHSYYLVGYDMRLRVQFPWLFIILTDNPTGKPKVKSTWSQYNLGS